MEYNSDTSPDENIRNNRFFHCSPAWYGDYELFQQKFDEGYTEAEFGQGTWIEGARICTIWILKGADKPIFTYQYPKEMVYGSAMGGECFAAEYNTEGEFASYAAQRRLNIEMTSISLKELIQAWESLAQINDKIFSLFCQRA